MKHTNERTLTLDELWDQFSAIDVPLPCYSAERNEIFRQIQAEEKRISQLEKLQSAQAAYAQAKHADRQAMQNHLELVDRYYDGDTTITRADMETAAQVSELAYSERMRAWNALDAIKAEMLEMQPAIV